MREVWQSLNWPTIACLLNDQQSYLQEDLKGATLMSNAANGSETNTAVETKAKPDKKSATPQAVNKYAEVRLAKKKQRRKAHRKTIGRSNTGG
jgi:hypothetical protein